MKPGYKTTEFLATVAFVVAVILSALGEADLIPTKYAGLAAGIAVAGYSISRGLAKRGNP